MGTKSNPRALIQNQDEKEKVQISTLKETDELARTKNKGNERKRINGICRRTIKASEE